MVWKKSLWRRVGFKKKKYSILLDDASVALCEKNQKRKNTMPRKETKNKFV